MAAADVLGVMIIPPAPITQTDMQNILSIDNRLRSLESLRARLLGTIQERLAAGAYVEPGIHTIERIETITVIVR